MKNNPELSKNGTKSYLITMVYNMIMRVLYKELLENLT